MSGGATRGIFHEYTAENSPKNANVSKSMVPTVPKSLHMKSTT